MDNQSIQHMIWDSIIQTFGFRWLSKPKLNPNSQKQLIIMNRNHSYRSLDFVSHIERQPVICLSRFKRL